MVELGHGSVRVCFPLGQLEQRALALGREGQLVEVVAAAADRLGIYSDGRM
jgi:hypothetical protein